MCWKPVKAPLLALLQHMNRFECANSLVLSAALITLCINRRMPTTILDIPVTCCQVTTCDRKRATCIYLLEVKKNINKRSSSKARALAMAAYMRVAGSQGHHFAAVCRSRAPAFLCSSSRITFTNRLNLQDGCFSSQGQCYPPDLQQQRHYASVGGAVKKAGAGWFRRKLYTLLMVAGVSGGALVYVSGLLRNLIVVGIILGLQNNQACPGTH